MDTLLWLIGSVCVCVCGRRCTVWKENSDGNESHEEEEVLFLCCSWFSVPTDWGERALLAIGRALALFQWQESLWSALCSSCGGLVFKTRTTALFLSWGTQTCIPWPKKCLLIQTQWTCIFLQQSFLRGVLFDWVKKTSTATEWQFKLRQGKKLCY